MPLSYFQYRVNLKNKGINIYHLKRIHTSDSIETLITDLLSNSSTRFAYLLASKFEIDFDAVTEPEFVELLVSDLQSRGLHDTESLVASLKS